jgi:hypothetical protein
MRPGFVRDLTEISFRSRFQMPATEPCISGRSQPCFHLLKKLVND